MATIGAPTANAKPVRHIHLDNAVSVKPKRKPVKRQTKAQRLYKLGKHAVFYLPYSKAQIKRAKRLMRNRYFKSGLWHEERYLVDTWDYSKRGVKRHKIHFMANYYSYLYGNYHYRMGYTVGSQAGYEHASEHAVEVKRNRSFWKGFLAGLYNSYGYRADVSLAKMELRQNGKISDDVAPPYSR